jgi:hypothetical protein
VPCRTEVVVVGDRWARLERHAAARCRGRVEERKREGAMARVLQGNSRLPKGSRVNNTLA